jgi:hypothetical protein
MKVSTFILGVIALELWAIMHPRMAGLEDSLWFVLAAGWATSGCLAMTILGIKRLTAGGSREQVADIRQINQRLAAIREGERLQSKGQSSIAPNAGQR